MPLLPPWINSNHGKLRNKKKSKSLIEAEKKHRDFLIKMGVYGASGKKLRSVPKDTPYYRESPQIPSLNYKGPMVAARVEEKVYSGTRTLIGIATMHKSNLVPIFADRKEDAIDIAKMRRG